MADIKLLSVVALLRDRRSLRSEDMPARNLKHGQVGTIVEILAPGVFEVEAKPSQGHRAVDSPIFRRCDCYEKRCLRRHYICKTDRNSARLSDMAALPYVTATGNIERALLGVQSASTPARVSQDFVKTILKIPGGSGDQITSFLKKIGFTNPDGSPSDLYKRFRNPATAGSAAAEALKIGYAPLYVRNEYMHQLSDNKLRGLIIEETGIGKDSAVVGMTLASVKAIKKFADWSTRPEEATAKEPTLMAPSPHERIGLKEKHSKIDRVGLNLSYTINLNLPPTSDGAVFNAIFKALRENLLKEHDE